MSTYKFVANTPANTILKELQAHITPSCSVDMTGAITSHQQLKDKTAMDMALHTPSERTAVWDLKVLGEQTEPAVRKVLIDKIETPMIAFSLYIGFDFWTDEEDALLVAKFKGKLPTAEKELADGIITRAKGK